MNKTKLTILITVLVAVLVGLFVYAILQIQKDKPTATSSAPSPASGGTTTPTTLNKTKVLEKGGSSQTNEVRALQILLNDNSLGAIGPLLVTDGVFGTLTQNRLFELTSKNKISLSEAESFFLANPNPLAQGMIVFN